MKPDQRRMVERLLGGGGGVIVAGERQVVDPRQRHFPEVEIRSALEPASFECLAVYGHDHDTIPEQPLDEVAHMKGVFIARAV